MASYEKAANGTWSVRFRTIENFTKKNKRLSGFNTKRDAEKAYCEYKKEAKENKVKDSDALKFVDLYEEVKNFQQSKLRESSYYDFKSKSDYHILPYFKGFKVCAISPRDILNWQNSKQNYSFKYKSNLRGYLKQILDYASKYYSIPNQLLNVDPFKNHGNNSAEMMIWNEDEFKKFIGYVDRIDYKAYFTALFFTGCRKGELLASNWSDWDLNKKTFNICKSITRKIEGHSWNISNTKNKTSNRKISIPSSLVIVMKEYKEWQKKNRKSQDFVFGGVAPFADSNIDRYFKLKCQESGVKKIRIHDFRHSHASYLIGHGISIVAVSKRLGHKNVTQTLNTYSHLIQYEQNQIMEQLENIHI